MDKEALQCCRSIQGIYNKHWLHPNKANQDEFYQPIQYMGDTLLQNKQDLDTTLDLINKIGEKEYTIFKDGEYNIHLEHITNFLIRNGYPELDEVKASWNIQS